MYYYRLRLSDDDGFLSTEADLYGFDYRRLIQGERIDDWEDRITLWYKEGDVQDYLENMLNWLVVSAQMAEMFSRIAGDEIQCLPVTVAHRGTGERLAGYQAINVLNRVSVVDFEHATYVEHPELGEGKISIIKHAFRRDAVTPFQILRLAEQPLTVAVSERIKKAAEAQRLTGFVLWKVPLF